MIYLIDIRLANNFFVKDVYSLVNGHLFCLVNMLLTSVDCLEIAVRCIAVRIYLRITVCIDLLRFLGEKDAEYGYIKV